MCGIAGIYNLSQKTTNKKQASQKIIKKMTDKIKHRGPDGEGFFIDKKVALGHRRLSIIDLSSAGHQPMINGDLVIVYNGEIYNYLEIKDELIKKGYKFKTETDTEVVLMAYKEWKEKCLSHFNGMWALAIYNRKTQELFCARDRMGVKPFYYYLDKEKFIFASEIKAFLEYPNLNFIANEQLVWDFLICGYLDHRQETLIQGIKELRGGYYLIINAGKIKIKRYWDLAKKSDKIEDQEAADGFKELFLNSVNFRLRSDVPIGTCLSGGLDSSAITMAISSIIKKNSNDQIGRTPKTFSAVYDRKKYKNCDERHFIKEVVRLAKVKPFYIFPSGKLLSKDLKKLIYQQDFPFGSTSIYAQYCVFRLAKSKNIKVMLDGQGADELLAGYHTFFPVFFRSLKQKKAHINLLIEMFYFNKRHTESLWPAFQRLLLSDGLIKKISRNFRLTLKNAYYNSYYDYNVFNSVFRQKYMPISLPQPNNDPFEDQSYLLARMQGLPSLLRYEDRNSMAFSIESRTPFLDYHLVEYIYNLSSDQKIRRGETKWIMRQALKGALPEKIRTRQDKIGFATPEEKWFKKELAEEMRSVFSSEKFGSRVYWDQNKVLASFDKFLAGEPIMYQLFWRIYNLELWLRRFID